MILKQAEGAFITSFDSSHAGIWIVELHMLQTANRNM